MSAAAVDVAALRRQARAMLPGPSYDYYAGGSGSERTLRKNSDAWRNVWLAPRVLRDVSCVDTGIELLGARLRTPVCVAPTGFHRLGHADGEVATAEGAARAGALLVLSMRSTRRIEEVAAAVAAHNGSWWFQVYVMRDRELTADLVRRAVATGARALVLTGDTPVVGRKRRDSDELAISDEDLLVNFGPVGDEDRMAQAADLTMADIRWLAEIGGGLPVIVKGVLQAGDAAACLAAGAAGVIVSNHGGRQLDGAIPTARALPGVAAELHDAAAGVYVDGGLRTGRDILAALALGAQAVFLGRPVLWALTCGGAAGVADLLTGLTGDLGHAMALAGAASVAEIASLGLADGGPPGRTGT
jgi:4-hydroxymandelate oxidase